MVATIQERKQRKERLALLALLALLGLEYRKILRAKSDAIFAVLNRIAFVDGVLRAELLRDLRLSVAAELAPLVPQLDGLMIDRLPEAVRLAASLATGEEHEQDGMDAARAVVVAGALGVPFASVVTLAVLRAQTNILGEITRLAMAGAPVQQMQAAIEKEIAERLLTKLSSEASVQLNAAFVAAVRATAEPITQIAAFRWNLSPEVDNHCKYCLPRDGVIYEKDAPELDEIPMHQHCACWLEPITETE